MLTELALAVGPVLYPTALYHGPRARPEVALTYDDGPHPVHTPRLLELLAEHQTPATFFWLGDALKQAPAAAREVAAAGHQIALHGDTHRPFLGRSDHDLRIALDSLRHQIAHLTGRDPETLRHVRPPFGAVGPLQARRLARWGYTLVFCDLLPGDWNSSPDTVAARIARGLRPGSLIALHDGVQGNATGGPHVVENTRNLLELLGARQLSLVALDSLDRP